MTRGSALRTSPFVFFFLGPLKSSTTPLLPVQGAPGTVVAPVSLFWTLTDTSVRQVWTARPDVGLNPFRTPVLRRPCLCRDVVVDASDFSLGDHRWTRPPPWTTLTHIDALVVSPTRQRRGRTHLPFHSVLSYTVLFAPALNFYSVYVVIFKTSLHKFIM